jgi:hypothetical protein
VKVAVIEWDPSVRLDVVRLAWPVPFRGTVPSVVVPSTNATVPVGVPVPGATGVTVAVNVTDCPSPDGFAEDTTVVVVAAVFTVWVSADDVLPVKLPSPP